MTNKIKNSKRLFNNGRVLRAEGNYVESIKAFTSAIDENVEFGKAYFERAACYYKLGLYIKAKNDLQAAAIFGCKEAIFWSN